MTSGLGQTRPGVGELSAGICGAVRRKREQPEEGSGGCAAGSLRAVRAELPGGGGFPDAALTQPRTPSCSLSFGVYVGVGAVVLGVWKDLCLLCV